MIASLKAYLAANVASVPAWYEHGVEEVNVRTPKPFGVLELGPLRSSVGNRGGAIQEVRVSAAWGLAPGAWDALASACEEIRTKVHGATLQRATGERYTLEWAQTTDAFPDPRLKALVQTVILSVPLRL